ncbi:F-box/LRR-repeat protein 7 [Linum perenne]
MPELGDDEVASILSWADDPILRKTFSLVCKQWLRVEGTTRLSIRVFDPDLLFNFLPRFPNLIVFESPKLLVDSHLEFVASSCPKIEVLNLTLKQSTESQFYDGYYDEISTSADVGDHGIYAVASGCPSLTKVLLRRRANVGNVGVIHLVDCARSLTSLDLGWCSLIEDRSVEAISSLNSIRVLNLEGCSLITDRGLSYLASGSSSRSLKKLIVADCDRITDFGVSLLHKIQCLEELNLAECGPKVTDIGGMAVASMPSIKRLNFSWLINVTDIAVVAIAENCRELQGLDLTGCELITGVGIRAFAGHECLESLVLSSCHNILNDDLSLLMDCKSLKYLVLARGLRMWIDPGLLDNISRRCDLHWR